MRGEGYAFEYIKAFERERVMPALNKAKRSEKEWIDLVNKGMAIRTTEQIPCNGIRISYKLI